MMESTIKQYTSDKAINGNVNIVNFAPENKNYFTLWIPLTLHNRRQGLFY